MGLLSTYKDTSTGYNKAIHADLGTWNGWAGSVRSGYKESVTSVGINWLARGYAGHLDRENGLEALDTEAFEKQYGKAEETGFEFMKDETPSQAEMRFQDFIDIQVQQRRSQSIGGFGRFAGGMVGNMASPADIALTMAPYAGVMKMAKATQIAIRTKSITRSAKIVDRLAAQKKNFLTTKMLAAQVKAEATEKGAKATLGELSRGTIFKEITKRGFQEQAAEAAFVMIGSHEIGRDYGMLDASADLIFGGILLSAINMPATFRIKKISDDIGQDLLAANTMDTMAEGGNIRGLIGQVQQYTKKIGENSFGRKLDASPRIKAILDMPQAEFEASPTARTDLAEFLYGNREAVWLANLKGVIPLDTRLSIPEARSKQHQQLSRIVESQLRGNKEIELTTEEFAILKELSNKNQQLINLVGGRTEGVSVSIPSKPAVDPSIVNSSRKRNIEVQKRLDEDPEAAPKVREAQENLDKVRRDLRNAKRRKSTSQETIETMELDLQVAKERVEAREREFLEQTSKSNPDSKDPLMPESDSLSRQGWARHSSNGYEVSSRGDRRFSAFNAKLKDGRTIEKAYQEAKGSGKGQPAKDPNFDYWGTYLGLWKQWAQENPKLLEDLRQKSEGKVLTDQFASTENNQARALATILQEGSNTQTAQQLQEASVENIPMNYEHGRIGWGQKKAGKLRPEIVDRGIRTAYDAIAAGVRKATSRRKFFDVRVGDIVTIRAKGKSEPLYVRVTKEPYRLQDMIKQHGEEAARKRWSELEGWTEDYWVDNPDIKDMWQFQYELVTPAKGAKAAPTFTRRDSELVTNAANRFMEALGFKVPVKAKRKEGSMAHYSSVDGTIYLDPDVRPDRALQLVFHELVHHFENTNPKTFDALNSVVHRFRNDGDFMDKILTPELRAQYKKNFGKEPLLADQRMNAEETAWFMTEATKHPEFWTALKQRDPKVFENFRAWLLKLWDMIKGNRRLDRSKMTADQKKAMQEFGEIVAAAEAADGGSRGQGAMDSLDPDANTPRPNLENIQAEARKTQEAIDKDTETSRQQASARQEEAAKEVEKTAAKAEKTPMDAHKEGIKANISDEFGDMAADTKTDPENLAGKIKEYLGKLGSGRIYQDMKLLGDRVIKLKRRAKTRYDHTRSVLEVKNSDPDPSVLGEILAMRLHGVKRKVDAGEITAKQGLDEMTEAINADSIQGIYTEIRDLQIQNRDDRAMEGLSQKLKLKFIKSSQDGLQRMGINLGRGSVAAEISAQMTKDMAKMRKVFIDEGFINYLDNTIDRVAGKDIPDAALRHKARVDASNKFMVALMDYYRTGEVHTDFKDNSDSFRAVGDAMRDTLHSQVAQINELGGGITLRQDHGGIAYRWDNDTLRRMGREGFKEKARKIFDAEKIKEAHGGVMVGQTNKSGFAETFVEFDFEDWLEAFYREATSPVKNADHSSMDIAKSFSKSRMVHVKEGMELEALTTFSGHENLGRLLQDQIRHRSEMIAISKTMGNKPLPNFLAKLERHGLAKGTNTTRESTGSKLDKLLVKTGFEKKVHDLDIKHAIDTAKFQTGALDNPLSHDVSFWGKTYRQGFHLAFLWTSTISAINDIPLALMTLDQMGGGASLLQLTGAMRRAASRRFNGEGDKVSQFYEGWGAGMDAIVNAGARRLALMEANGDNMVAKMSESMFTINGLNFWTAMMQEAFADVLTSNMGRMAQTGDWDPHMKFTMESMGIRGDDFKKMEDAIRDVNGVDRLSVHDLGDSDLQGKLLTFFATFRDQAVLVPDASTQALVRFGLQAGTFWGETARSVFQYASFPVAMNRITQRKLMMNHGGTRPWTQGQLGLQRMITYMGAMAAFSYLSILLKDLSRLRGPVMPWEMSGDTAMRMMDQSGILGAVGNIVQGGLEGRPSAVVSPNVSTQFRMANKLMTEGFGSALYAGRAYTGDNIPFAGDVITSGIAYAMHFTTIDSLQNYGRDARVSRNFLEQRGTERLVPLPD